MRCDTRLAVIVPAVITIILGGLQIYTFSCHEDIDVSLHHKHKKGDGKQHRAYDHELLQKSHSTLTEEESFDEKIKADYDHKVQNVTFWNIVKALWNRVIITLNLQSNVVLRRKFPYLSYNCLYSILIYSLRLPELAFLGRLNVRGINFQLCEKNWFCGIAEVCSREMF